MLTLAMSGEAVPIRLAEGDARVVLLIEAVEETDEHGALLAQSALAAATRRALETSSSRGGDDHALRARALLLWNDLATTAPELGHFLGPARLRRPLALAIVAAAACGGALANALGPERQVSVLAFPLAGILLWNLAVYAALAARTLAGAALRDGATALGARGVGAVARWLESVRLSDLGRQSTGTARSAAVARAVRRFGELWLPVSAPLIAARARTVLHLAALAAATGAIASMYVSGIAFEYRATWESTWLDPPAVQRYLDLVLGPAAHILGVRVPDVAPLRKPGGDGPAAPWIHLWGATLILFVVGPRGMLALSSALSAARLSRRLPVEIDAGYARRALAAGRGTPTRVEVVYYSCVPDAGLRERVHALLQERAGARAMIRDAAILEYGDGPELIALPSGPPEGGQIVVVFPLAQTPEADVHGEFIEGLRERLDGPAWPLSVVLDGASYRRRAGADRARERRATWDRLLRDLRLTAIDLE